MKLAGVGGRLAYWTAGSGPPLLLLHGFTGSHASFAELSRHLPARQLLLPDLLGHGSSAAPLAPEEYSLTKAACDLVDLLDREGVQSADVLGYSLGGRAALHLALAATERVRRLVLVSTSPGIADPVEREARRRSDEELAELLQREGVAAFVAYWESLPLFATLRRVDAEQQKALRATRLGHSPQGLAGSLRGAGQGAQESLWEHLAELTMPVLLVVGEEDAKYRALAEEMRRRLPRARVAQIAGAGHALHLEAPAALAQEVRTFLTEEEENL